MLTRIRRRQQRGGRTVPTHNAHRHLLVLWLILHVAACACVPVTAGSAVAAAGPPGTAVPARTPCGAGDDSGTGTLCTDGSASLTAGRGTRNAQLHEFRLQGGVRLLLLTPEPFVRERPTRLVFYAAPNGSTAEQTLGCRPGAGMDWRYDIQHVAAQVRRLREVDPSTNYVLACAEAEGLSWPAWRQRQSHPAARLRGILEAARRLAPGPPPPVDLAGHSGGGSFLLGLLQDGGAIPPWVERLIFLDASYSYSDAEGHGDRLLLWLRGAPRRSLLVLAYDDRNIMLNGRPVIGPTGGTYRATHRMLDRFRREGLLVEFSAGEADGYVGLGGQVRFWIARNPGNRILHTALVGEWNGLLHLLTLDRPAEGQWGVFGGPRAYERWVSPGPLRRFRPLAAPARPLNAPGGSEVFRRVTGLPVREREAILEAEIAAGNFPDFLRTLHEIRLRGRGGDQRLHDVRVWTLPDYLAVGSDDDWLRVPLTPMTAQALADRWHCTLPTPRLADAIFSQSDLSLSPRWLTRDREAVAAFALHHRLVEEQRAGRLPGALVGGVQKDVVLSNRILERPRRLALYGWHHCDGAPIQPLTIVHANTYVDYSHGIRLLGRRAEADGAPADLSALLRDPVYAPLLSDEGPLQIVRYPGW